MRLLMRLASGLLGLSMVLSMPALANDISNSTWSETDGSNNHSSPNGWASGVMLPSQVEPTARAMMGAIKRFYNHLNGTVTSGGSANVQTLTYSIAPAAYVAGDTYSFKVGTTNTSATSLNVNGLGAITVQNAGLALIGGELPAGQYVTVVYDGTNFQILNPLNLPDGRIFGAKFDGVTDDTTAAQAMVTWSNAHNMPVSFPPGGGTLLISSTLAFTGSHTGIICPTAGVDHHDVVGGVPNTGCWIKGAGGGGTYLVTVIAPTVSTSSALLDGIIIGAPGTINFDGNAGAWNGALHVESIKNSVIKAMGQNFSGGEVFNLDVVHATPTTFGEGCDTQHNDINLNVSNYSYTSKSVGFHAWVNPSITNGGCNFSANTVNIVTAFGSSTGLFDEGGDNNTINFAGFTTDTTQNCVDLSIRNDSSHLAAANSEHFLHYGCNGLMIARGTTSFPTCVVATTCVRNNIIDFLDVINGTPAPTSEPGTSMASHDGQGIWWRGSSGSFSPGIAISGFLTGGVAPGNTIEFSANQPTIGATCTGLGSGGTCTLVTNSTDTSGGIVLNTGSSGTAATGQVQLVFYSQFTNNVTICTAVPGDLGSGWNSPFGVKQSVYAAANTTLTWFESGALNPSSSYVINYHCFGE